jgi:hypothetical protein
MHCVSHIFSRAIKRKRIRLFPSAWDFKRPYRNRSSLSNFQTSPSQTQLKCGREKVGKGFDGE